MAASQNTRISMAAAFCLLLVELAPAQTNVLTGGYGNSRTNANLQETILSPATVKPGSFGKKFSVTVDGQIYAQPLYVQGVAIPGKGTHNVVYVATMHNTVYAFDADTAGVPLWNVNLGPSVPTSTYDSDWGTYQDIMPENGILSTPVIDGSTGTIYAVAATWEKSKYLYRLHALDFATGLEKFGAPTLIAASVAGAGDGSVRGAVAFIPDMHLQRPALLLTDGAVYVAFGAHADAAPYHGWIMAYSARNVQTQLAVFNASPNGAGGAIWQSGRGLTSDDSGNIYAVTSNGTTDETSNYSDNVLRLDSGRLRVRDWFAPYNFQDLNDSDTDLGSCGAILIDGTNFLVTGGKQGVLYLLDRTSLGKGSVNDSAIVSRVDTGNFGVFNLALWNRPDGALVYSHIVNSPVTAYRITGGNISSAPVARSMNGFNVPFQGMTLSANGVNSGTGVLWVLAPASYPLPSHAVLHAYNADGLSEIWNSDMADGDEVGGYVKFVNPTAADGKVFVPSASNQLVVFGAGVNGPVSSTPLVTSISNAASYAEGGVAPGEMLAIQGVNLGPAEIAMNSAPAGGVMGVAMAGTQVLFNGIPGPVFYASSAIVTAIVPYAVAGASDVKVKVIYNGKTSAETTLPLVEAAPGLFSADSSGSGPGAILNADYSLNGENNPASAGGIVVLYGTGGGQVGRSVSDGAITTTATPLVADTTVTVNGEPAEVLYAGNAGGIVAGVVQLNIRLPLTVSGTVPVVVTTAGASSQATVTVAVK